MAPTWAHTCCIWCPWDTRGIGILYFFKFYLYSEYNFLNTYIFGYVCIQIHVYLTKLFTQLRNLSYNNPGWPDIRCSLKACRKR